MSRKQINIEALGLAQKRRQRYLQGDLLRIVGAIGFSRSLLWKRTPWDEAARDPNNYEPFRPTSACSLMIRDVTRTVRNRGNDQEIEAVRKAVTAFYETALRDALEPLARRARRGHRALTHREARRRRGRVRAGHRDDIADSGELRRSVARDVDRQERCAAFDGPP
jgi:hypothetical protein